MASDLECNRCGGRQGQEVGGGEGRFWYGVYACKIENVCLLSGGRRHTRWTGDWSSDVCSSDLILDNAPPRFSLAGLSMGGYIAFAMMRLAPERIARLALLDTAARADTLDQTAARKTQIDMTKAGRYAEIPGLSMPRYVHKDRQNDVALTSTVRRMAEETGPDAF